GEPIEAGMVTRSIEAAQRKVDVVVLEQLLADIEVASLDLALGGFDRARHHAGFDGLAFRQLQALHDGAHPIAREDAHQRVFEREIEARRTRVALATCTAAQLVVDTPRLVSLRADDAQTA